MKVYTNLEQSKKLAEILPLESADMHYISFRHKDDTIEWVPQLGTTSKYDIPCWSLAALLGVLPYPSLHKTFAGWRCDSYDNEGRICTLGENAGNAVDACVAMIEKLNELNLL